MSGEGAVQSSYLRYLPPVLWAGAPPISLGELLLIFEKIFTGVADDEVLRHGDHTHEAISTQIDRVHRVFNTWAMPERFLRWLAACVALEVPTLRDDPLWNEYQRRTAIGEIARIYPLRGTKAGLAKYLELFSAGRARIAIDDGARLLAFAPKVDALAPVTPLISQGPVLAGNRVVTEGLLRPWCLASASDGGLMVGDIAMPDSLGLPFKSRVWYLDPAGNYRMSTAPPRPQPLAMKTLALTRVVAVAVRPPKDGAPETETLYVLDRDGRIYALAAPFQEATQLAPPATVGAVSPVAMTVDLTTGDLLVLDRGAGWPSTSSPKIITVRTNPVQVSSTALSTVKEPLSLAVQPDGTLLVGDGRAQTDPVAGNLIGVNRTSTLWTETALLPPDNPLVAPTGIARTRDGLLYVLDAGLKPFAPPTVFPFVSAVALPAGVFRVDLGARPSAVRITEPGQFVYPTAMVAAGGRLVICDPGQPLNGWSLGNADLKKSRAQPFQFDVIIHFVAGRLPQTDPARRPVMRRVTSNVRALVERERPAHVRYNIISTS